MKKAENSLLVFSILFGVEGLLMVAKFLCDKFCVSVWLGRTCIVVCMALYYLMTDHLYLFNTVYNLLLSFDMK